MRLRHQIQIFICETLLYWAGLWAPHTDEGNRLAYVVREYFKQVTAIRAVEAVIKKNGCP